MTPAARVAAAIEVLTDIVTRRRPAADALKDWGIAHRFAGSGDRAAIAGLTYDALRRRASAGFVMDSDTPRAVMLGMLRLERNFDATAITQLADGSRHAPSPLTNEERSRLEAASLEGALPWVAGDYPEEADQPSRRREPRGARGRAAVLPGRAAADLPRPRAAGRRRHPHGRDRGPDPALLRRRLARVRARPRGARGGREDGQAHQARGQAGRAPPQAAPAAKPRSKNEQARAKKLEGEIEKAEAALAALEVELADPGAWNDPRTSAKSTARHAEAKKTLEELYARWELGRADEEAT